MDVELFLKKYYKLLEDINATDLCTVDEFYSKIYEQFFEYMAEYYNFITEYSDDSQGVRAIQGMHRLINRLKLPVKEFKVPSLSLHIFYNQGGI